MISDDEIRWMLKQKFTVQEISDLKHIPYSTLWNTVKRFGLSERIARQWVKTGEIKAIMALKSAGRSYAEIARVVGRNRNSVAGIIHREKQRNATQNTSE